jgi:hypothetical protein
MTIFELVKIALDELYKEGEDRYATKVDDEIKARMLYLSTSYGELTNPDRKPIDYKDPATRFAYVYKYVAAHGDYLFQTMQRLREKLKSNIFSTENIRVSCVGGGPGSDIIGILKYLDHFKNDEPVENVRCFLLDREQSWADAWSELDESLGLNVRLNSNFQPLDVTNSSSWEAQRKFLQADIFTLSFFVSEVYALDGSGDVTDFWRKLFTGAKSGALFLYNDNGHGDFNGYFDSQCEHAGLQLVTSENNFRITPSYSEKASELEFYKNKFNHSPKIQGYISLRVYRKP